MVSGSGTIYGSYQHASTTATLEESKKYTISHLGYGKVIKFNDNVKRNMMLWLVLIWIFKFHKTIKFWNLSINMI